MKMAHVGHEITHTVGPPVPWLPGTPLYANSFRCNVKEFLHLYGRKVPLNGLRRATAYIVELQSPQGVTRLHIYEEKLDEKDGAVCDQCRCMGKHFRRPCQHPYSSECLRQAMIRIRSPALDQKSLQQALLGVNL